jgi:hypothetical protein
MIFSICAISFVYALGVNSIVNDPAEDKEDSDFIIFGTISKKESFEDPKTKDQRPKTKDIYTNVTFNNVSILKGEKLNSVILQLFGGSISIPEKNVNTKMISGGRFQGSSFMSKVVLAEVGEKWLVCLKKHEKKKEYFRYAGNTENCQIQDTPENLKKIADATNFFFAL